jgi:hypothetical protein
MPIIPQSEPSSRPKSHTRSIQIFPSDELTDFSTFGLTNEQIGVLIKLRLCAWHRGGIPNTEESLNQIRKQLLQISPRKFAKIWPILAVFFTEIAGFLLFSADEDRRVESELRSVKLQEAGRKGGQKTWGRKSSVPETDASLAMFSKIAPIPSHPNLTNPEAAAADKTPGIVELSNAVAADAAQPTDSVDRKPPARQETEFPEAQKLIASCKKFSDVTPDFVEKLAILARAVDPNLDDGKLCEAIRATFKREKQESAGLWLHTVPAWLRNQRAASA